MKKLALELALVAALSACAAKHSATQQSDAQAVAPSVDTASSAYTSTEESAGANYALPPQVILVYLYQFKTPVGFISKNNMFWKYVDEDALDVSTYKLLYRNGLRLGRVAEQNRAKMLGILDDQSSIVQFGWFSTVSGKDGLPVDMTPELGDQLLFVLGPHGVTGRWYDLSKDRFAFAFQWERHRIGVVRVTICPVITTQRQRFNYAVADDPDEQSIVRDENLYDLVMRADLGPDETLVLAPSPAADDPYRVGSRFMIRDGPTERLEQILILSRTRLQLQNARLAPATRKSE
jgi:hypothetical protein